MQKGIFVISLDFEMYWGIHDVLRYEQYKVNLDNTRIVVKKMLSLFEEKQIHTTWATVGFLFCKNKEDLMQFVPKELPAYKNPSLSPYFKFNKIQSEQIDHVLYAPDLTSLIKDTPFQEVATHTFSHYYCLEKGQTKEQFLKDIEAAIIVANRVGIKLNSIVLPRNQSNNDYLDICKSLGIRAYRGNESSYIYNAGDGGTQTLVKRAIRLLDAYFNITGYHTYKLKKDTKQNPYNIPASRFLRPYSSELKYIEFLKLKRIKDAMTYAARNNEVFHLWWHPHNFGKNIEENFKLLENILDHYLFLKKNYDFMTCSMKEITDIMDSIYEE